LVWPKVNAHVGLNFLSELSEPEQRYEVGDVVRFPTPDGAAAYAGVVQEVGAESLLFDFNHPLAGQSVTFEVHLIGVL
jgi:FKBP-type peptidyl-prolyl cis-trans isomerase SlpA